MYSQKVVRITVDIPYQVMDDTRVGGKDALKHLNLRVGSETGIDFTTIEDQDQDIIQK